MTILLSFKDDRLWDTTLADTSRKRWVKFARVVNSIPLISRDCKHADFWLFPYFINVAIEGLMSTISNHPSVIGLHILDRSDDWLAPFLWLSSTRLSGLLSCLLITSCCVNHGSSSCLGRAISLSTLFSFCFFISFSLCFGCCSSCSLRSGHWSQVCILVANVEDIAILEFEGLDSGRVALINRLTHSLIFKKFQLACINLEPLTQFCFQVVQGWAKIDLNSGAPCFWEHPKNNTTHLYSFEIIIL